MEGEMANSNTIQDFLTPEAMLTPGVAGSMTMMITNALATNFNMPRAWLGLSLSFVFGLLVLVSTKGFLLKALFYVLNSLVIFCVAVGANGLGANSPAAPGHSFLLGISPAYGQASAASSPDVEHWPTYRPPSMRRKRPARRAARSWIWSSRARISARTS
jgi:hypothetical protein